MKLINPLHRCLGAPAGPLAGRVRPRHPLLNPHPRRPRHAAPHCRRGIASPRALRRNVAPASSALSFRRSSGAAPAAKTAR
jgi:hypothetical protein